MKLEDEEISQIVASLDERCWQCSGSGQTGGAKDLRACDMCDGIGYRVTSAGDDLLKFIARHGQRKT